eukprot:832696_1
MSRANNQTATNHGKYGRIYYVDKRRRAWRTNRTPRPFIIDSSHGITQNQATPALPHGINQNQATHVLPPQNTYQPPALPPINAPYSHTYSTHASSSSSAASVEGHNSFSPQNRHNIYQPMHT